MIHLTWWMLTQSYRVPLPRERAKHEVKGRKGTSLNSSQVCTSNESRTLLIDAGKTVLLFIVPGSPEQRASSLFKLPTLPDEVTNFQVGIDAKLNVLQYNIGIPDKMQFQMVPMTSLRDKLLRKMIWTKQSNERFPRLDRFVPTGCEMGGLLHPRVLHGMMYFLHFQGPDDVSALLSTTWCDVSSLDWT